jgi:hypothetical protein
MFEYHLNTERSLNFLVDHLPELLEEMLLEVRQGMWSHCDNAQAHFARCVRQFLRL